LSYLVGKNIKKKTLANPVLSKTKADIYYSKPILDIMFRKWFPLSEMPSLIVTTPEKLVVEPVQIENT
jgi:hypothetical protein